MDSAAPLDAGFLGKVFDVALERRDQTHGVDEVGPRLEMSSLEQEILAKMHTDVKIRPAITWLKPFTLERATKKTQFLEKLYEKK
jgi:hypothetical protein